MTTLHGMDGTRTHPGPGVFDLKTLPKAYVPLVVLFGLAVSGAGLNAMVAGVWQKARAQQPALRLDSSMTAAGQGVTLALLGGFRALVADATWIRMYAL